MERRKLFSTPIVERRKLFSTPVVERRKLFSTPCSEEVVVESGETRSIICQDCGYTLMTGTETTNMICPKCGGTRFNFKDAQSSEEPYIGDDEFSGTSDSEIESALKIFSGQTIDQDQIEKNFSGLTGSDLVNSGYATETEDGNWTIGDNAFTQSKLFSKLTITITKELDLPEVQNKCSMVEGLAESGALPPRGIMLIKRAHGIKSDTDGWIKDSGIDRDLGIEFGGTKMDLAKLEGILSDRYDDAPFNIIDALKNNGIITLSEGDQVSINKVK